ncbi:Hypothetical predicted protein [Scomber scombrus]|uniref:Uncharacterized protein n=1 Tax=Scomber scombrus TaxID=13677 RepID=A0AAV1NDS6_SCOSC
MWDRAADICKNSKKAKSCNMYASRVVRVPKRSRLTRALNQPHVISSFSHFGSTMRERDRQRAVKPDPLPEMSTERNP